MTYALGADVLINYASFTHFLPRERRLSCLEPRMARGGERKLLEDQYSLQGRTAATLDRPLQASMWELDRPRPVSDKGPRRPL